MVNRIIKEFSDDKGGFLQIYRDFDTKEIMVAIVVCGRLNEFHFSRLSKEEMNEVADELKNVP